MTDTKLLDLMRQRVAENQRLAKGGLGSLPGLVELSGLLAVHPWRVIVPLSLAIAFAVVLLSGRQGTEFFLNLFGGK